MIEAFWHGQIDPTRNGESQMPDRLESLFVYGTLLPGHGNHARISDHVRHARPGTIQGILVDLGAFPALVHGEGIVKGMLLDVDDEAIRITDYIEGCRPDQDDSLYAREKVAVDLGDGTTMMAWTYFFARPDRIKDQPKLAVSEVDGVPAFEWPSE